MFIKSLLILVLIKLFVNEIKCNLIFEDDFNQLNSTKWIFLDRKADCERLNPRQRFCDTSNEINLRTINGTLAITAVNEAYFDRKFTSATIVTKRSFRFDGFNYSFRIRAALTKEPGLMPHVFLILDQDYRRRVFTSFYTIISRTYNKLWNGRSLDEIDQAQMNNTDLEDFQDYDLIITKESRLIWRINNKVYLDSPSNESQWTRIIDRPFRLGITLDLDSDYTEKQLDEFGYYNWNCSTFLVESVHILKSKNDDFDNFNLGKNNNMKRDISEICASIQLLEDDTKITPGLIKPLKLLWSDEFEENSTKQNHWIIKNLNLKCENNTEEKGCNFYDNPNIEISNGTLKLYPINRQLTDIDDISSLESKGIVIASVQCFKNVRVEIRAKRPIAADLTAKLYMQAYQDQCNSDNVRGILDIAKLRDQDELFWPLHSRNVITLYSRKAYKKLFDSGNSDQFYNHKFFESSISLNPNLQHTSYHYTFENLDDFNVYAIEWNENGIQWLWNDHVYYQANQKLDQYGRFMTEHNYNNNSYYLPYKRPFNLLIKISASDYDEESDPPVFEIDYIRVYGNQLFGSEIIDLKETDKQIEQKINKTEIITAKGPPYLIIGVSSLILILLIILVISLVVTLLKIRDIKRKNEFKKTNENQNEYATYDEINKDNVYSDYDYTDIYQYQYAQVYERRHENEIYEKLRSVDIQNMRQPYLEIFADGEPPEGYVSMVPMGRFPVENSN